MTLDLDRVHWPSFSIALRVFMVGFSDKDADVAQATGLPEGVVQRARCGQRIALLHFKRLCAFLDRDPQDFVSDDGRAGPPATAADRAPASAPQSAPGREWGGAGGATAPASQGNDGAAVKPVASSSSDPSDALSPSGCLSADLPQAGSFDR